MSRQKPGPTGEFPEGKIKSDDAGEIKIAIAADRKRGVVLLDFGVPVTWLGFNPGMAETVGRALIAKAKELRGKEC